ncbi:atrial natriuretic peptide receptor 2-like [Physella acuta]|uniref:atrial natriuretic peptide receptor 2-like n=1 Tax=Physella acuta TaxID=109671 RepID=UPI0027DD67ED|nr:atrial natriuretic peptide receptor 2-like [Physella acuta]
MTSLALVYVIILWELSLTPLTTVRGLDIQAEGASFPDAAYQKWTAAYSATRMAKKQVKITYKTTGSGGAVAAITTRPDQVDFVGSDNVLSDADKKKFPDLVIFPLIAGGLVIGYNLPTCSKDKGQRLNLTREHVVGIYNGTFTTWSHPSLQKVNPNCSLPNATIAVIARQETSGSTKVFTSALSAFDDKWAHTKGIFSEGFLAGTDTQVKWGEGVIRYFGKTNRDVAGLIRSIRYTAGYLSYGDAMSEVVDYAAIGNRNGQLLVPDQMTIQESMNAKVNDSSLTPDLVDADLPRAYPIVTYSYIILYRTEMRKCDVAMEILRYLTWCMKDEALQEAMSLGFVALSATIATRVTDEVLETVTCKGEKVMDMVRAEMAQDDAVVQVWVIPVAISVPLFLLVVGALFGYIMYQRLKLRSMINMDDWSIAIEDIVFFYDDKVSVGKSRFLRQKSVRSLKSVGDISEGPELLSQILQWPGKWKSNTIGIRMLEVVELRSINREMKKTMIWMRDSIINTNVVRFFGLTELEEDRYIVGDFCAKGTILDVLQNGKFNLTTDFKVSLAVEIAAGMAFLHVNGLVHGMLTSYCCMLDNKWTVKIGDWEFLKLLSVENPRRNPLLVMRAKGCLYGDQFEAVFKDFWTAPEILRSEFSEWPNQASDVYSYAIILQEIFTRDDPYFELADHMTAEQIIHAIVYNRLRPEPSPEAPVTIRQVMELAWSDTPAARPTFEQITKMLRRNRTGRKTIMDNMMEAMEDYTAHLEEEMEAKENALQSVKSDLDNLISELVPSDYSRAISAGEKMESTIYPALGVIMLDVSHTGTTMEMAAVQNMFKFLGRVSSQLKQITKKYHAYSPYNQLQQTQTFVLGLDKQEVTLNDRCQAVAYMALDIMRILQLSSFETQDKTSGSLDLQVRSFPFRIGAHVGTVATGNIGVTSPQFVLLGDGIDVSHALLASADVNSVRISRGVYSQLEKNPDFELSKAEPEWVICNMETWLTK